ncbi:DUF2459 domain-containing protein [Desulfovibrio litoralis]|uniref:DUF2459 domain-containing protein n=1 Tax=Desulfovibrio litoralis DSM 11393 TaxID=1121455 RepID=A0A1M7T331_9BACT|nr:DUF2459 domain-containing protein [Desulfovibrio litoralis]SHN65054.1 Protein of unknown function [Desulfovibrio litoralis DSM 11393]
MFKTFGKYSVITVLIVLITYFLLAFILTFITYNSDKKNQTVLESSNQEAIKIYLLDNGFHLDLVLPCLVETNNSDQTELINLIDIFSGTNPNNLSQKELKILQEQDLLSDYFCQYLIIGWGQKDIFMKESSLSEIPLWDLFKVVFANSEAVIRVYELEYTPKGLQELYLSKDEYIKLINFIKASLKYDNDNKPVFLEKTKSGANFYQSSLSYNSIYTCNHWINLSLANAGVKVPLWSPFIYGIKHQLTN